MAAPVPLAGDGPVPVDRVRVDNPAVLPMTGTWRFKLEHGISPAIKGELPPETPIPGFAVSATPDADWKTIPVPANWEIEGFSIPTYQERDRIQSDDVGLYRRWVDVPASFAGKRILWHFDAVYDGAEIFVNGQRVGYHESGFTAFDIDITKDLKPGEPNFVAIRVYKKTSSGSLDKGDFWCLGGIPRETYLVALPPLHVDDITVVTDLDEQYKDATLQSAIRVVGLAGTRFTVSGELYTLDGAKVPLPIMRQMGEIGADGSASLSLTVPVPAPKLWSAEKPNLYYVFYHLTDGEKTVERVQDRIGFRKIELKKGVLTINGVPVKLAGVNRHDEFGHFGHALTEECWQTDIALLKEANVNAIRTAHYNHAARFLELCDEAGFYVLDEVPFCWVAPELGDLTRQWAFLLRSKETLARDKNRACVVIWSCGNESGYGPNAQASFDYMKANDPTRLALISQQGLDKNPKADFDDYHYPPVSEMLTMLKSPAREKVPAIYTEIGGVEDPWGKILVDNWVPIWASDNIAGAFIWEWQEQHLYDKFPSRWSVPSPGSRGFDLATGMRLTGGGGAVTADRQMKPNRYWNLKTAYSPVTTAAREFTPSAGQCVVPIQNRYSFTDLSELTCRWRAFAGEKELAHGENHIAAKPRSTVDAAFPATPGMDTLRLEFFHPDGRSVYVTRLRVKGDPGPAAPVALPASGPVRLSETDRSVIVLAAGTRLVLDKSTGHIGSWRAGEKTLVLGGPFLTLGETIPGEGPPAYEMRGAPFLVSNQAPECRNVRVTAQMDGANARIEVTAEVYLVESELRRAQLTYALVVSPDAQADLSWKLVWLAADASAKEAGLSFLLPPSADQLTWFSDSLWTETPIDHIGNPRGSVHSRDITFGFTRRDIRWVSMSGVGPYGLVAQSSGTPLRTHVRVENHGIRWFLSSGVASTGRDVTGDVLNLTQTTPLAGAFRLRVTAGNSE